MSDQACQASPEEMKRDRTRCWRPGCTRRAWLRDWCGWQWCLPDMYRRERWGDPPFKFWRLLRIRIFF